VTAGPSSGSRADHPRPAGMGEPWWVAPARLRQTRLWLLFMAEGAFLLLIEGVAALLLHGHIPRRSHPTYLWIAWLPGLILFAEGAVFLWLRRRGIPWAQPSPVLAVKGRARRQVMRAIRQGELPDDANGDLTVAMAHRLTEPNPGARLFVVAAAGSAVGGILSPAGRGVWFGLTVIFAITAVWLCWYLRRYQKRGAEYLALTAAISNAPEGNP